MREDRLPRSEERDRIAEVDRAASRILRAGVHSVGWASSSRTTLLLLQEDALGPPPRYCDAMARLEVLRRLRPRPLVVDTLIAVFFAIFAMVQVFGLHVDPAGIQRTWPLTPILLAGTLPLALRRVVPLVPPIAVMGALSYIFIIGKVERVE